MAYSLPQYGALVKKLMDQGMTAEEIAEYTDHPLHSVELAISAVIREESQ